MTFNLFLKSLVIWFIIAIFAVINGVMRESIFVPYLGQNIALPLSGITLCVIIFAVTYLSFKLFENNNSKTYLLIGVLWVSMTLAFEIIFGHFVRERSWSDLLQVLNIMKGDLFIIVLLMSLFAPILVAKVKLKFH